MTDNIWLSELENELIRAIKEIEAGTRTTRYGSQEQLTMAVVNLAILYNL